MLNGNLLIESMFVSTVCILPFISMNQDLYSYLISFMLSHLSLVVIYPIIQLE